MRGGKKNFSINTENTTFQVSSISCFVLSSFGILRTKFHLWFLQYKSGKVLSIILNQLPLVKVFQVCSGINEYRLEPTWSFLRVCYFLCTSQHCVKLVLRFCVSNSLFASAKGRWYVKYHRFIPNVYGYIFTAFAVPPGESVNSFFSEELLFFFFVIQFNGLCINQKTTSSAFCWSNHLSLEMDWNEKQDPHEIY